jgi:hypothetical protein
MAGINESGVSFIARRHQFEVRLTPSVVKSPLKSKRGEYPAYEDLLVALFIGIGLKTRFENGV